MEWELKTFEIATLNQYAKNPRILSERGHRNLTNSLGKFNLVGKPYVNTDNTIIAGHQRIRVLAEMGRTEVQCWVPDRLLNEKEVEELNITDNLLNGDFDYDILGNEFDVGDLLEYGMDEDDLGLGKPEKAKKPVKPVISLEFSDKGTMLEYMAKCEAIAQESSAKLKVKG